MSSLKDVYQSLVAVDHEKTARAQVAQTYGNEFADVNPELIKQAQDYDYVGRVLAHNVFSDLVKQAMDEDMPEASDEEKKKKLMALMAKARGEGGGEEESEDKEESDEEAEKKAHVAGLVLQRMSQDPEYVSALVAKYYGG